MTGVSALSPLGWLRMAVSVDVVSWLSAHPPLSQPSCSTRSHLQGNVNHHSNEGLISGRICPPWLCGREGTSPPWSKAGCGGFSRACLCFCALPLCATSPTLPTTCWLLSWLFCVTSSAQCPQRTCWGPKFCIKDVPYIQGQSWDFWGSNCLFSSIWGLFGVCTQLT